MNADNPVAYFFAHTDTLGATLFCLLALMSLASWFVIFGKALWLWQLGVQGRRFRRGCLATDAPAVPAAELRGPHARFARAAFAVHGDLAASHERREDLLMRTLQRVAGTEGARLEYGQTLLAAVAAVAPFVGLFGTVWSVHNALAAIGVEGSASLGEIAGPVGEALIMTALGLAVAIPAVLAHAVFARSHQRLLGQFDALAHELYHYLITGQRLPAAARSA